MQPNLPISILILVILLGVPTLGTVASFFILKYVQKTTNEGNKIILKFSSLVPAFISVGLALKNAQPHDNALSVIYGIFAFVQFIFCLAVFSK